MKVKALVIFILAFFVGCDSSTPFKIVNEFKDREILKSVDELPSGRAFIVALGYALGPEGEMKPRLIKRLKKTWELAVKFPKASIIVTGAGKKSGLTEAGQMKSWLVDKGVAPERIHVEDQAQDTVGNAKLSSQILFDKRADSVTLVSCASHLARASILFRIALNDKGLQKVSLQALAHDPDSSIRNGSWSLYRDAFRMFLLVGTF